jgi:hypothetical protein
MVDIRDILIYIPWDSRDILTSLFIYFLRLHPLIIVIPSINRKLDNQI